MFHIGILLHHDGKSSPLAKIHANAFAVGALPQTPLGTYLDLGVSERELEMEVWGRGERREKGEVGRERVRRGREREEWYCKGHWDESITVGVYITFI